MTYLRRSALALLCLFALASCGPVKSLLGSDEAAPPAMEAEGEAQAAETAEEGEPRVIAPLTGASAPPGAGDRPPLPGQSGHGTLPSGMPALQPKGVNLEELFAARIKDTDDRFERVENAVVEMRRDLDAVIPSIVRLVAVEQDMQDLLRQLDTLLQNEPPSSAETGAEEAAFAPPLPPGRVTEEKIPAIPLPPPGQPPRPAAAAVPPPGAGTAKPPDDGWVDVAPAPAGRQQAAAPPLRVVPQAAAPAPAAAPPKPAPAAASGPARVLGARIGAHPDKTRLVLDLSGPATYRYDLDNTEKLLVLELPGTGWAGAMEGAQRSGLIASWAAQPSGDGGTRLIIQLRQPVTIINEDTLPASAAEKFRIVLDMRGI